MDGSPPSRLHLSAAVVDLELRTVDRADGEPRKPLTPKELRFLEALVHAQGRPVPREDLLRDVWDYHPRSSSRTIDSTVRRLRRKIEADPAKPVHLLTVHQVGYRLVLPPAPEPEASPLIGRAEELRAVRSAFAPPGVVVLIGVGGIGKTSLALAATHGASSAHCRWADLDGVRDVDLALQRVAASIGIPLAGPDHVEHLARYLAETPSPMLVLDGAEGVADELGPVLAEWRRHAPALQVMVTSRVRLRGVDLRLVEIGALAQDDAAHLMWARVQAVRHDLADTPEHREALARLAVRLDGMPLAIELAAARANLLSPQQLLDHVEERLALLSGPARTITSVLDASWALASPVQRDALIDLALFEGGFQLPEASHVLGGPPGAAFDLVQALRDQSWLRVWTPQGTSDLRLGMYESVRDYLNNKPRSRVAARQRHAESFARLGRPEALQRLRRDPHGELLARLGREHANVRTAFQHALEDSDGELVLPLWRAAYKWLHDRGPFSDAVAMADRALARGLPPGEEGELLHRAADLHRRLGDVATAESWMRRAVELADTVGDATEQAATREQLAGLLTRQSRNEEAEPVLDRASAILDGVPMSAVHARVAHTRAAAAQVRGDLQRARRLCEEALSVARRVGDHLLPPVFLNTLAGLARIRGDLGEAVSLYTAAIEAFDSVGGNSGTTRMNLANLCADRGEHDRALVAYGEALEEAWARGNIGQVASIRTNLATVHLAQGALGTAQELLHQALLTHRRLRWQRMEAATLLLLGEVALRQGNANRAEGRFGDARAVAERGQLEKHRGAAAVGLARAALLRGDVDEAETWIGDAEPRLRQVGYALGLAMALCVRGQTACERGHHAAARCDLDEVMALVPDQASQPMTEVGALVAELQGALRRSLAS